MLLRQWRIRALVILFYLLFLFFWTSALPWPTFLLFIIICLGHLFFRLLKQDVFRIRSTVLRMGLAVNIGIHFLCLKYEIFDQFFWLLCSLSKSEYLWVVFHSFQKSSSSLDHLISLDFELSLIVFSQIILRRSWNWSVLCQHYCLLSIIWLDIGILLSNGFLISSVPWSLLERDSDKWSSFLFFSQILGTNSLSFWNLSLILIQRSCTGCCLVHNSVSFLHHSEMHEIRGCFKHMTSKTRLFFYFPKRWERS